LRSGAVYDFTVGCDPLTIVQDALRRFTPKVGSRKACQQGTLLMMSAGLYAIVQGLGNVLGTPAGISGATK
jgi:hypothetical protein